jgi:hypothetical protein
MPAQWRIEFWPKCQSHVFLSHCAEDRDGLIDPVCASLADRRIEPWMDRYDYPLARGGFDTLHEDLLKCRHIVYFITPAMLRQGRGWSAAERALSAAIQQHLCFGEEIAHIELPLLFIPPNDAIFNRSIWRSLVDKTIACIHHSSAIGLAAIFPSADSGERRWSDKHVEWASRTIEMFVRQEEDWAAELALRIGKDSALRKTFSHDQNLFERILAVSPPPLPYM